MGAARAEGLAAALLRVQAQWRSSPRTEQPEPGSWPVGSRASAGPASSGGRAYTRDGRARPAGRACSTPGATVGHDQRRTRNCSQQAKQTGRTRNEGERETIPEPPDGPLGNPWEAMATGEISRVAGKVWRLHVGPFKHLAAGRMRAAISAEWPCDGQRERADKAPERRYCSASSWRDGDYQSR